MSTSEEDAVQTLRQFHQQQFEENAEGAMLLEEVQALYLRSQANWAAHPQTQPPLSPRVRDQVVNWMIEVAEECHLSDDTLYTAIVNFDRFLASHPVAQERLQLVATATLFTSAKFFETRAPLVQEFPSVSAHVYSAQEVREAEMCVLRALSWRVRVVTPMVVAHQLFRCVPTNHMDEVSTRVKLFVDLAHGESALVRLSPFVTAVACAICAFNQIGLDPDLWIGAVAGMVPLPLQEIGLAHEVLTDAYTKWFEEDQQHEQHQQHQHDHGSLDDTASEPSDASGPPSSQ